MRKNLVVLQEEASDCGICSLLSIMRFFKGDANKEKMRMLSNTTHEGVTAYNLIECAKSYGFQAQGLKLERIAKEYLPCIAHLKITKSFNHFIVVYREYDDYFLVMDPSIGMKKMAKEEFYQKFTKIIIHLKPYTAIPYYHSTNTLINKIKKFFLRHKLYIISILTLNLLINLLLIIISNFLNIWKIMPKQIIILMMSLLFLVNILFYYKHDLLIKKFSQQLNRFLTTDFFKHIFNLPLNYLHIKDTGEILKRIDDLMTSKEYLINAFINVLLNSLSLVLILVVLGGLNNYFLFIMMGYLNIIIIVSFLFSQKIPKLIKEELTQATNFNSLVTDTVNGLTSINHCNERKFVLNKIMQSLDNYQFSNLNYVKKLYQLNSLKRLILYSFMIIQSLIIYYYFSQDVSMSIFILSLTNIGYEAINNISEAFIGFKYIWGILHKVNDFYEINTLDKGSRVVIKNIKFKNVNFSYNGLNNVINNMSFFIKNGEKVLLMGASGTGKSTICRLINGEYLKYAGSIKLSNVELKYINNLSFKDNITYLSQEEHLFLGTIKENIVMGLKMHDEEFKKIIDICYLEEVLAKKVFKEHTLLLNEAYDLSGGERQRIILARMLAHMKNILILDEPLSEVSIEVEKKIIANIIKNYPKVTLIYISHRRVEDCFDRVLYV